jgi:hypothetical protein
MPAVGAAQDGERVQARPCARIVVLDCLKQTASLLKEFIEA